MADYEELIPALKKLLTKSEGEVPAIAESRAAAVGPKTPDVVGEGTSKSSPSEPEVKDAEVASQQAPVGPDQAQLEDKSNPWADRLARFKSIAPYAGAAAAGTAADVAMEGGNKPPASSPPASPTPAKAAAASDDDDEALLSDLQKQYEPDRKPSTKSAPIDKSATSVASDDNDSKNKSDTAPNPADISNLNTFSIQRLAELQQRANKLQALNTAARGLTNAVATGGQTRNLFDQQFADASKNIGQQPQQYIEQAAMQKMDPNSQASIAARNLAAYIDPDFKASPNMSAADLEKINPQLANISSEEDAQQARLQGMKMHNDTMLNIALERNNRAREAADSKQAQIDTRRRDAWSHQIATASSRTPLGAAIGQINSIDRVEALLNGQASLKDVNPQELHEVVAGLDRVVSGTSTQYGRETLDPKTLRTRAAQLLQEFTNQSQGAHAEAFLGRIHGNLEKQRGVIRNQAQAAIKTNLAGIDDMLKRDPTAVQQFLGNMNLPVDLFTNEEYKRGVLGAPVSPEGKPGATPIEQIQAPNVKPAIKAAAQAQAAQVVQDDNKAKSDVAASAPQQPSAPSLQNAAAIEKARRAALKAQQAQQGGQ